MVADRPVDAGWLGAGVAAAGGVVDATGRPAGRDEDLDHH